MSDTNDFLKMYDDDRTKQINDMYDAQKASTMAGLESAYNQNMSNAQAAKEQINPTYQQSANDVSAAYERTRRNNNQMAIANGLNTGAQGQQAVAQSNAYMNSLGQVRTAQANALNAADRGIADMEAQYKMQVAQALANNDYQRAAALFDESQNQYARSQDRAKILAGYGDFSGYAGLYGQDAANQMSTIWNTQNPDLAFQLGRISGEQYYNITGKYPIGYTPAGGGYSGGVSGTHDGELYIDGKPVTVKEYMKRLNGETPVDVVPQQPSETLPGKTTYADVLAEALAAKANGANMAAIQKAVSDELRSGNYVTGVNGGNGINNDYNNIMKALTSTNPDKK